MAPALLSLGCFAALLAPLNPPDAASSYLYQPAYCLDEMLRGPAEAYQPQAGDIFLASDNSFLMKIGHRLALSGAPQHSGIVFARPDGRWAILEAGPHNSLTVEVVDLLAHCRSHTEKGELVWIRRRLVPLSCEQSGQLTAFALAQEGKRFALGRLLSQITPFRSRGPLRIQFLGAPHGERERYFCSELVLECCIQCGLLDPNVTRPAATYPRDLFFGGSANPFLDQHLPLHLNWAPPARWLQTPGVVAERDRPFPTYLDGPTTLRHGSRGNPDLVRPNCPGCAP